MPVRSLAIAVLVAAVLSGCQPAAVQTAPCSLDDHARAYVELVAALGARDAESVDGPRPAPRTPLTAGLLISGARELRIHIETEHADDPDAVRWRGLADQLASIEARAGQLIGARVPFDEEVSHITGERPAWPAPDHEALAQLERTVPGRGPLADRLAHYEGRLRVSDDRLAVVFERAIAACRAATARHVRLPDGESLEVSYVDGSPWSGYSRYVGRFRSTLAINRHLPLTVDRIVDLACHEGYPGHHALSVLRDHELVERRGWIEMSVMPVFSPQSYWLEALASAAPRLAMPSPDRLRLERDVLFPLAGLNPEEAAAHVAIGDLLLRLDGTIASLTDAYLRGELDRLTAAAAFRRDAAMAHSEATLAFINRYRAYSTAYTAGRSAVWSSLADQPEAERWQTYLEAGMRGALGPLQN